jgi:solute carrier family 10 (sodium/bile acid cotransporter), member 7
LKGQIEGFSWIDRMKIDGFLLAMLLAILAALAAPQLGAAGGPLHLSLLSSGGIALVFFLHGAALSPKAVSAGAANWRLHVLIHSSTYVLFPILGLVIYLATRGWLPEEARLGIFFLSALSSTISSSVAMTALGRGNVAGAVFDATLSGMLGMVLTPLLVGLVASSVSAHLPLLPAIIDVTKKLLLPFVAGQLARPLIGAVVTRYKPWVTRADRSVIVLIVYGAFCDSTAAGVWQRYSPVLIGQIAVIALVLLGLVLTATTLVSRRLGFTRADEVAAVFCGSKKSLANGAPIASVLFAANPNLGMLMLPLILYHQLQLIVCSMLARRYARQADTALSLESQPA